MRREPTTSVAPRYHPDQELDVICGPFVLALVLVEKLQAAHPSRIRVIYRILPNTGSARLHYAALEAYAEGHFDAFLAALTTAPRSGLSDASLLELAKNVGMDPQQLAAVISNP